MDFESKSTKSELEKKLSELRKKFRTLRKEIEKSPLDENTKKKVLSLDDIYLFDYRLKTVQTYLNSGNFDSAKEYLKRAEAQLNEIEKKYTHAKMDKRSKRIIDKIIKEKEWDITLDVLKSFRQQYSELENYIKLYEAAPGNLKQYYKDLIKRFIADKEEIQRKIEEIVKSTVQEEMEKVLQKPPKSFWKTVWEFKPPKTFWKFDIPEFMGLLSLIIGVFLTLTGWLGGWFIGPSLIVVGLIFAPLGRMEFKHHLGLISFVTGIIIAFYGYLEVGGALAFLGFGLLVADIFEPIGNVIKYIAAGALLILIVPPFLNWIGIEIDFVTLGLLTIINSLFLYIFWGFEKGKSAKERLEEELLEEELKLTKARREWVKERMKKEWIMEKARNLKNKVRRWRGGGEEGEEEEE